MDEYDPEDDPAIDEARCHWCDGWGYIIDDYNDAHERIECPECEGWGWNY